MRSKVTPYRQGVAPKAAVLRASFGRLGGRRRGAWTIVRWRSRVCWAWARPGALGRSRLGSAS